MLYRDQGARWVDENVPIDRYPMAQGNITAETNAHRFSQSGGTGIVLRFGWFYGPGAAHSEQMLAQARHHIGFVLGPPNGYVSSIHVADAAAAVAAALSAPAGTFNIVDDESDGRIRIPPVAAPRITIRTGEKYSDRRRPVADRGLLAQL
jgi:nucleoside-diphosphate-sugar epimerase